MEAVVQQSRSDSTIRQLAVQIVAGLPNNDLEGQVSRLTQWVKDNVTYVRDPADSEYLVLPLRMISDFFTSGVMLGDCDDHVMLLNSLLESVGFTTKPVGVKFGGSAEFNHVISGVLRGNGQWELIDPCAKSGPQPVYAETLMI